MDIQGDLVAKINSRLKDDISKEIFMNRLLFSMTEDYTYIKNVVLTTYTGKRIYERMKQCKTPIGIFGAGRIGRKILRMYEDIEFECFIDNNRSGEYEGLPVLSLEKFLELYIEGTIVISMREGHDVVERQIKTYGIPDERIINYGFEHVRMPEGRQYFDLEKLWNIDFDNEIFVDGGAFDGNTTKYFLDTLLNRQGREGFAIVCEPEKDFFNTINNTLKDNKGKYEIFQKGLWNEKGILSFKQDSVSSTIDVEGDESIEVDTLDHIINEPVSFIKMDIEGAEYRALCGAKETIKKYMPRLAICVYHKKEDIVTIPKLVLELGKYDLFFRHYTLAESDTVLYALPKV